MQVQFQKIAKSSPDFAKTKRLYQTAFPRNERAPLARLMKRTADENAVMFGIYDGAIWVGLLYVLNRDDLSYIFYFAIDDEKRGKGYGTAAMREFQRLYAGRRIFLAAEQRDPSAENYAERCRRADFYLRCGFSEMHMKIREASVVYDVFGVGGNVAPEEYEEMMRRYLGNRWCKRVAVKMFSATETDDRSI